MFYYSFSMLIKLAVTRPGAFNCPTQGRDCWNFHISQQILICKRCLLRHITNKVNNTRVCKELE